MWTRRDPIFWAATLVFAISLVLAIAVDDGFLLLAVGAYLLRPTLHSLGFARKLADERQLQIQYRASNVAFVAMVLGNIVVILQLMGKGDHTWEMVNAVLLMALAVRAVAGLLMVGDPAVAGRRIVMVVGAFFCLFGLMEGGLSGAVAHVLPGLVVVALGWAADRAPRAIGGLVIALAATGSVFLAVMATRSPQGFTWGTSMVLLLVGVPLATGGVCLLRGAAAGGDGDATGGLPPTVDRAVPKTP